MAASPQSVNREPILIELCESRQLSLDKTFNCGQCFRWNISPDGYWEGIVRGNIWRAFEKDGTVFLDNGGDSESARAYFDLDTEYPSPESYTRFGEFMGNAAEFGRGIRILNQEPFETLISFIISQCNNITRIKKIIETLAAGFGKPISPGLFAFPGESELSAVSEEQLKPLSAGYRAKYIVEASRKAASGELNLTALTALPHKEALAALQGLQGIGPKVANCVLLFGLGFRDAFPIDTWMKKALAAHFPPQFDPGVFSPYAGIAQQYIFHYARNNGKPGV